MRSVVAFVRISLSEEWVKGRREVRLEGFKGKRQRGNGKTFLSSSKPQ